MVDGLPILIQLLSRSHAHYSQVLLPEVCRRGLFKVYFMGDCCGSRFESG